MQFTIVSKNHLRINLTELQGLCTENDKTKKIKTLISREILLMDWETQYCQDSNGP